MDVIIWIVVIVLCSLFGGYLLMNEENTIAKKTADELERRQKEKDNQGKN